MPHPSVWPSLAAAVVRDDRPDAHAWVLRTPAVVFQVDWSGQTVLHQARSATMARLLIQAGASLEAMDTAGWTPLGMALRMGRAAVARALLRAGADARRAKNALHWAAFHGEAALVTMLLEAGLNPAGADALGRTPLHWVFKTPRHLPVDAHRVASLLTQAGALWGVGDQQARTPREQALSRCREVRLPLILSIQAMEDAWRALHGLRKFRRAREASRLREELGPAFGVPSPCTACGG